MSKKIEKFKIEDLEQRFEMSWVDIVVGAPGPGTGTDIGTGETGVPIGTGTPGIPVPLPPPPTEGGGQ